VVGVKILDEKGRGDTAEFLAGIQWVITNRDKYNIRIANMSVGAGGHGDGPLIKAVEAAWDRGIVVCAAAGNNGPDPSTVTAPGTSRKVITVGSSDDHTAEWLI
jgi:serine protease AprX